MTARASVPLPPPVWVLCGARRVAASARMASRETAPPVSLEAALCADRPSSANRRWFREVFTRTARDESERQGKGRALCVPKLTAAHMPAAVSCAWLPFCHGAGLQLCPVTPAQREIVLGHFDRFARDSRAVGLSDQDVAEFMLTLSARWLVAHGIAQSNLHLWIQQALRKPAPLPLTAAARARNDFGASR